MEIRPEECDCGAISNVVREPPTGRLCPQGRRQNFRFCRLEGAEDPAWLNRRVASPKITVPGEPGDGSLVIFCCWVQYVFPLAQLPSLPTFAED